MFSDAPRPGRIKTHTPVRPNPAPPNEDPHPGASPVLPPRSIRQCRRCKVAPQTLIPTLHFQHCLMRPRPARLTGLALRLCRLRRGAVSRAEDCFRCLRRPFGEAQKEQPKKVATPLPPAFPQSAGFQPGLCLADSASGHANHLLRRPVAHPPRETRATRRALRVASPEERQVGSIGPLHRRSGGCAAAAAHSAQRQRAGFAAPKTRAWRRARKAPRDDI